MSLNKLLKTGILTVQPFNRKLGCTRLYKTVYDKIAPKIAYLVVFLKNKN